MANLPTSLNIHQPNISDGSDLLRMAAMLSKEASETANKGFTDFKSTMRTSANNNLAAAFANGIASGLSPDEAFKQASGTINSWTSANAINAALQARNAEKEAILRENMDRRAEASENRQQLDWEGANKAAEANNLFNLAHATNNMNLFKQAEALTQGYDDITKKHVKPTEMATLQDSLATNALQRARLQAELDNTKRDRLAKEAQSWYIQYRAKNPNVSTYEALSKTANTFGIDPEALQRIGLFYGLSMGTDTTKELTETNTGLAKFTDEDVQKLKAWNDEVNKLDVDQNEANALLYTEDEKLSDQEKQDKEALLNILTKSLVKDSTNTRLERFGILGDLKPRRELLDSKKARQFILDYLKTNTNADREKLLDTLIKNNYSDIAQKEAKDQILNYLKKNFKDLNASNLSLSDMTFSDFNKVLNNQDLGGTTREEQKNIYKLAKESFALKQESAKNNELRLEAIKYYNKGDYVKGDQYMNAYNKKNIELQERAKQYQTKFAVANSATSLVAAYTNYQSLIEGKEGFDIPTLTQKFGADKAKSMEEVYHKTIKELNDTPSLQIPDKAIRLAIIQNPNETDEDDIIEKAKIIKGTMVGIANSSGTASSLFDFWLNYKDPFNLPTKLK